MSFLSNLAKPFVSIFNFLESPKGKVLISAGEGVVVAIDPALAPMVALVNSWMDKVVTTEQIATAAGAAVGTGTQKAAAVMSAMAPEISKYFPAATTLQISNANNAVVAFLQAFDTVTVPPTPAAPKTGAAV